MRSSGGAPIEHGSLGLQYIYTRKKSRWNSGIWFMYVRTFAFFGYLSGLLFHDCSQVAASVSSGNSIDRSAYISLWFRSKLTCIRIGGRYIISFLGHCRLLGKTLECLLLPAAFLLRSSPRIFSTIFRGYLLLVLYHFHSLPVDCRSDFFACQRIITLFLVSVLNYIFLAPFV